MNIHRFKIELEVFAPEFDADYIKTCGNLRHLEYYISEDSGIGEWNIVSEEVIEDPQEIREHLIRIGNDGSFYDELLSELSLEDEEDLP